MYFGSLCFTSLPFVNLRVPSGMGTVSLSLCPQHQSWADKLMWSMNIPWNGWGSDNLAKVRMETVQMKVIFFFK